MIFKNLPNNTTLMKTIINLNEVYTAPTFEVCEVAVEEGFAASTQTEDTSW